MHFKSKSFFGEYFTWRSCTGLELKKSFATLIIYFLLRISRIFQSAFTSYVDVESLFFALRAFKGNEIVENRLNFIDFTIANNLVNRSFEFFPWLFSSLSFFRVQRTHITVHFNIDGSGKCLLHRLNGKRRLFSFFSFIFNKGTRRRARFT